jgi:flagellar motor component MotA
LVRKHLGTVIAGAFMTGFFGVFDAIFDTLRPK